jgi:hypothetical protein
MFIAVTDETWFEQLASQARMVFERAGSEAAHTGASTRRRSASSSAGAYRDTGIFCTPDTRNLTNGVRVLWAP